MAKDGIKVDVKGTVRLIKAFKKFGDQGQKQFAEITKIAALDIEAEAKRRAAVDTGKMRQAIRAERLGTFNWHIKAYEIYSIFVEFGTRYMAAQPFLYPAWRKGVKTYTKDLKQSLARLTKDFNNG